MSREEDVLTRVTELGRENGLDPFHVTRLFREILGHSCAPRRLSSRLGAPRASPCCALDTREARGVQLPRGAAPLRDALARDLLSRLRRLEMMLEALEAEEIDRAILPLENSTSGSVTPNYDLLARMSVAIVGERSGSRSPASLAHRGRCPRENPPRVLPSCGARSVRPLPVDAPGCEVEAFTDTAMSARRIREDGDRPRPRWRVRRRRGSTAS